MDERIRELDRRVAAGDRDALRELCAARARLGQFTCCGRLRPPGSCGLCWHCRGDGEVLVGEHRGGDRPGKGKVHIVDLVVSRATLAGPIEEDVFARCDRRYRGPGPMRWGRPTCRRLGCNTLWLRERHPAEWRARATTVAWYQLCDLTRHAPTILYDGTPILVPGLACPECPGGEIALEVIGWATDTGEPEDFDVTCSADCDTEEGHGGGSVWLDVMDEVHAWASKHVRVARG